MRNRLFHIAALAGFVRAGHGLPSSPAKSNRIPADVRIRLMIRAQQRFPDKKLTPTIGCRRLSDGFRIEDGEYRFWFNTPDHSTHIIREQIISCSGDRSGRPVIQTQQEEQ